MRHLSCVLKSAAVVKAFRRFQDGRAILLSVLDFTRVPSFGLILQEIGEICFPVDGSDASPLMWGRYYQFWWLDAILENLVFIA